MRTLPGGFALKYGKTIFSLLGLFSIAVQCVAKDEVPVCQELTVIGGGSFQYLAHG